MVAIRFFNTLTRAVDTFEPIQQEQVRIYCCGPTVYNYQHIGNLRTYIFEDTLVRALRYAGHQVQHVMNITDVGHLVSDADDGEDKMLVAMRREGKTSEQIADFYTKIFFDDCGKLNIRRPDVVCKATEHIAEMIDMIGQLEKRGFAYQAGGNVYFDVAKFSAYGELAKLDLSTLRSGARIEVDSQKRSPLDFALWFTKSKFEGQELQWDSPWGRGYPGWHIECSAMARRYLGDEFDIHCGGIDHIPVHHTNEIAQSQGATGRAPAKWWMHGAFLLEKNDGEDAKKMSKSAGAFLVLDRIIERGIEPLSYRLMCYSANYRSELAFSWSALEAADATFRKVRSTVETLRESGEPAEIATPRGRELLAQFESSVFDDLAMPRAIAVMHAVLGASDVEPTERLALLEKFDEILGLGVKQWRRVLTEIPAEVTALADERLAARRAKNWGESDRLRGEIAKRGFAVLDAKDTYTLKKASS